MTAILAKPIRTVRARLLRWECPTCGHTVETEVEGSIAYCWHRGTVHYGQRRSTGEPK